MNNIVVVKYEDKYEDKWDKFIYNESYNGTILQTRSFLNYHPKERFKDHSLLFFKGGNTLIAVIPACESQDDNGLCLNSHSGSTFGGIIFAEAFLSISNVTDVLDSLELYLKNNKINKIYLKMTSEVFTKGNNDLIYYLLFNRGYSSYDELSFCIDLKNKKGFDFVQNMKSKTRNEYRASCKNNLVFRMLLDDEIEDYYNLLKKSLLKYNTKPVHSLEEMCSLKNKYLKDRVEFYGVFLANKMIAGSLVFLYDRVFHTQYLAADPDYLNLKPMNFLDGNLIRTSYEKNYDYFSFGISTENHGLYLNESLAKFKEGFGTGYYINKTFYKQFNWSDIDET
ncbi:MAG: GNAT family N-acetyltransferase [Anaeroplasma sp.]|nr:GNAT family N-acetyltransferase [Anaeroplasma sp.]